MLMRTDSCYDVDLEVPTGSYCDLDLEASFVECASHGLGQEVGSFRERGSRNLFFL